MSQLQRALISEYVRSWLHGMAGEVGYSPSALNDLSEQDLDLADVLYVLETSNYAFVEKENPHETIFTIEGTNCDDEPIKMILNFNPHIEGLYVKKIARL
jgi:hypothetical protein